MSSLSGSRPLENPLPLPSVFLRMADALDRLEQALQDTGTLDVALLALACQNFTAASQTFDVPTLERALEPTPDGGSAAMAPLLTGLQARLERLILLVENQQEAIGAEMQSIRKGRKGLQGYQCLVPIHSEQYVSISR